MKILVVGVAGFIGSNLAGKLLEAGHIVSGIDNYSYGCERNMSGFLKNGNFKFVLKDASDRAALDGFEADVVVHLASQKIPRYTNALRTLKENQLLLANVVDKCVKDGSRLIFASTSDIYGKNPNVPFGENSDLVLGPTTVKRWAYALSKIYGEHYIIANHDEYGLKYTITRFFGSYGPNQHLSWWGGPQSVFISRAIKKEPLEVHGDGGQMRTFTYVDDTIRGLIACITNKGAVNEIFNIGAGADCEISILDLAKRIWRLVNGENSDARIEFVPYESFGRYEDVQRRIPDTGKMRKFFGFEPEVGLDEGLKRTIAWQMSLR